MTTPAEGQPATVINNLPAAKNISSTTNATPIVITTSTAHNLLPGDYFYVAGADDNALNGIVWMAGAVTSTTVVVLVQPTGANSVGTLVGGANGTVKAVGFGTTVPLLSDGDKPTATLWNVIYQALLDYTAYLIYVAHYAFQLKAGALAVIDAGATLTAAAGSFFAGTWDFITTSKVRIAGRRVRGPRTVLSDANHTIDVTMGNRFILPDPAAARIITLDQTTGSPSANETIEFIATTISIAGTRYTFQRPDTTVVATFDGPSGVAAVNPLWVEFELVGGVYRLGASSGSSWDPVGAVEYGVIPGPGA